MASPRAGSSRREGALSNPVGETVSDTSDRSFAEKVAGEEILRETRLREAPRGDRRSAMSRRTAFVAGYYGFGNTGDEAILTAFLAGLRGIDDSCRFVVASGDPAQTSSQHGVEAISWRDPAAIADEVKQSDLVIVGGGGLFQDYWGVHPGTLLTADHGSITYYSGPAVLGALARKPVALYGLGFGPLESADARRFTRGVCQAASFLSVRDAGSRDLLISAGVAADSIRLSADPAFTLGFERRHPEDVLAGAGIDARPPIVGVALRNWSVGVEPAFWEREVVAALDLLLERTGGTLLFVPFERSPRARQDDFDLALQVRKRLRHAGRAVALTEPRPPSEIAGLLAGCDLVLGMRLHSLIFAISGRVPLVGLSYDPKVQALLEGVGLGDYVEQVADVSASSLLSRMERALERRGELQPVFVAASSAQRRLAEEDLRGLAALLVRPPAPPPVSEDLVSLFSDAVTANIRRTQESAAALESRRAEGAALSVRVAELERRLASAEAEREEARRQISLARTEQKHQKTLLEREKILLEQQLGEARVELNRIHQGRLWKAMNHYWRARRALKRFAGGGGAGAASGEAASGASSGSPADWVGRDDSRVQAANAPPPEIENRHDVVCFPIIDWDFRFQRPQQLMKQFAKVGHRVFYVAQRFRSDGPPWEITPKLPNIYEVTLRAPEKNVYKDRLGPADADALFEALDALRRDRSLGATVSIVQLPFWSPVARRFREERAWPVVYDLMDHHAGFSSNEPAMLEEERGLLESAGLVLASSASLEEDARRHNEHVLRLPNACDYEHFASASALPNARPVVGYYGAISDWFDSALVAELAERRPDWDFVLVGSTWGARLGRLPKLPNVALPGEKSYAEIPKWLAKFDVAIIPFQVTPLTEATNPVKAYEILAAGKPLVSAPLPELSAMAPFVRTASTAAEFEKAIEEALADTGAEAIARRRGFARENTWEKRFDAMAPAVARTFPKLSIVVVTYNNRELNELCLESLTARTEWPNFEIVVVDNASTDGTPSLLERVAARDPRIRPILNDSNRGFAAASNAGVAASSGEYLILLNNDTVVTRGWAAALVRHLAADPALGLVGPVTNAISNEARVPVEYTDMAGLPDWARNWALAHDEESFPIPMLAFFCVATRRAIWDEVGPLDERFSIGMFEDDDYTRRVREKGYAVRCARDAFVHHWQMASFRRMSEKDYYALFEANKKKYEEKWGGTPMVVPQAPARRTAPRPEAERHRPQLQIVVDRIAGSRGAVVFLPSIGWGIHLFQRPHHMARLFARLGYVSIFDTSNAPADKVDGFREIEPNLFLFNGDESLLQEIPSPVLWTLPYNYQLVGAYPPGTPTVYDWIDDLSVFPYSRKLLERNHRRALREATVVATVARRLHEQALETRPDALYLPNGCEYERFAAATPPPHDEEVSRFLAPGGPVAGYYGALAEWFDYPLLDRVAELKPDWRFVLIGPQYDSSLPGQKVLKRPNVRWFGPRDYLALPGYLGLFDVATIPFLINEITLATSPLKLYEYFAAGKPVVTTPMPECMAYPEVRIAKSAEEFVAALEAAREQGRDPAFRSRLQRLGRENSWEARVRSALTALAERSAQPAVS
jgi:polysaccharide pyruvyl transferase CsaB